jgi:PKD repeat protein
LGLYLPCIHKPKTAYMKKIFTLLFIIAASLSFSTASANTVYVSGYVKNNGVAVANKAVKVWVDSANAGPSCYQVHIKHTNANGFYSDTLNCGNNITVVKTSIEGCNGALVINTTQVNANFSAESNFNLTCAPPTPTCVANYSFSIAGNSVQFANTSTANSTIASYFWSFGDGSQGTVQSPTHIYPVNGTYNVCLSITSSTGCMDSVCKSFTITANTPPAPACNAEFQFVRDSSNYKLVKLFAGANTAYPSNDPVVERRWRFGDGDSLLGNVQNPTHTYANAGTYNVCLRVKTQSGCVSELCKAVTVTAPTPPPFVCTAVAGFTYVPVSSLVKFNSNVSTPGVNDTIISRRWVFGDSTAALTGNIVDPQHQYAQPGIYNVCLTIKTSKGCERTYCAIVTATHINSNCVPQFTFQKIAPKKVTFNSTMSWVPQNDSIVERKWTFGDGTSLTGAFASVASPTHQYNNNGIYTVCLKIKTALGCVNEVCKPVVVQDSIVAPPAGVNEPIKILSIYPNPVTVQMATVVWSANNNVTSELAIYDIYGLKKWSITKILSQGNNFTVIPTGFLPGGPYFFRVTTNYGVRSRGFYKL